MNDDEYLYECSKCGKKFTYEKLLNIPKCDCGGRAFLRRAIFSYEQAEIEKWF